MEEIKKIKLPGISFEVSQICLGTAYLGSREDENASFEIMDAYYERGGRFLNTAHEYGDGGSERVIGKWIRERGIQRDDIVITSKCGEDDSRPEFRAMHAEELFEDIDESLARSGLDHFDFYELHIDDVTVGVGEIMDAMNEIRRQGKIRYYGCSNWSAERQKEAAGYADKRGIDSFRIDEIEMNLTHLNVDNNSCHCKWLDREYAEYHKSAGMAVGTYSPIANGVLTKYLRDGDTRSWKPHQINTYSNDRNFETAKRIGRLAAETGYSPTAIQMAWHLSQPYGFVSFPIIGARNVEQLSDSLSCLGCRLTPDMADYLTPAEE
ncbi:MAG: aldo/keto reductase [Clostridiales bacterium]|nr:aldo/keto reductase [Clostridiales bacterium]